MIGPREATELVPREHGFEVVGIAGETPTHYVAERLTANLLGVPLVLINKETGEVVKAYLPQDLDMLNDYEAKAWP